MRALMLAVLFAAGCSAPAASSPTPSATITASPTAQTTATSSASGATATATPRATETLVLSGTVSARATRVPTEFRYVAGAEGAIGRVWLVDLARGTVIDVVAVRTEPTSVNFSVSLDGRYLLVSGSGPTAHAALYFVDVAAGTARLLYEDVQVQAPGALGGVLSADGNQYAFANLHDVRVGDTAGGAPRLLAAHDDPSKVGGTWRPAGWSTDGRWVALTRASETESEVAIVDTTTNAIRRVGVGTQVAWRPRTPMPTPELVVSAGASAFGGSTALHTYDIGTSRSAVLMSGGSLRIGALAWHPAQDRFLYTAGQFGPAGDDVFTWRLGDAASVLVGSGRRFITAWWSSDGSKIYAFAMRQDALAKAPGVANYEAVDLSSGAVVATVCRGDPRAACP